MAGLRTFFRDHRALASLLLALTIAMKALVPAGYMLGPQAVGSQGRTIAIEICDGQDHHILQRIVVGDHGKAGDGQSGQAKSDGTCPYGALGHAGLAGADPIQLTLALAFILALAFAALIPATPARVFHLRPPLRGPPSLARPN